MGLKAHPCHCLPQLLQRRVKEITPGTAKHKTLCSSTPPQHLTVSSRSKAARMVKLIEKPALPKAKGLTHFQKFYSTQEYYPDALDFQKNIQSSSISLPSQIQHPSMYMLEPKVANRL